LSGSQKVVEVPMDALQWDFAPEEVSLQQRRESYDSHKFDLKDLDKPKMQLEEGGDVYR
jgi:hypothetical protein